MVFVDLSLKNSLKRHFDDKGAGGKKPLTQIFSLYLRKGN
jgi:hypothetical protein